MADLIPRRCVCTEMITLAQALGRVTAEDVFSPLDVPARDSSDLDGYALRAFDVPELGGYLVVVEPDSRDVPLQARQAARTFSGAPLPAGADSVVPLQRCRVYGPRIWCPPLRLGEHVRKRGQVLERGQPVVSADKCLDALDIDLLAAAGIPRVKVYRLSTA
ncbi:hypothetical protein [Pseudomonas sp. CHM02]|uniref:hypothetical protein n=1 Tax=Pseudomonas sp. CHM02 TaxID=1463662 RepID=UPI00046FA5CE|nr:hypothetical protein [Pseudomonas sp. CHM02]